MKTKLQDYFPMIRTREEILSQIGQNPDLSGTFENWNEKQRQEFLDLCTGVKGVKILYDAFFKEIMNPENAPEHLEELLSLLLKRRIKIVCVLPNDSTRIADENSLLITDIVVQLEDGSLANVEVQKIGYFFPGQRSACYSADMLLRQYRRIRSEKKKKFSYKDIKSVYTIIFYEKSTTEFHRFPNTWLHYFEQRSDTGLELDLLQKYLFIPLDIFHERHYNKVVTDKLDAWLMFFCAEEPEEIVRLIENHPRFKPLYEIAYNICRNMEKVMGIFSEELLELDRNTVQYMMDEMQDEINRKKKEIKEMNGTIKEMNGAIKEMNGAIKEMNGAIKEMNSTIVEKDSAINKLNSTILSYEQQELLTRRLLDDGRFDDLKRAMSDPAFQEKLLKDYHII